LGFKRAVVFLVITSMGLEKAKSLLEVKGGNTFLDVIAEQV
jgi:UDP-N-acetylglucosamine pyrophosphorylase